MLLAGDIGGTKTALGIFSEERGPHAALAEGEARWMLETQLVRARNRIADVLEDCRRTVVATLSRLG